MKTILIIPAFNEAECIAGVVGELRRDWPSYDYVVVNDGSTDATADVCRANGFRFIDLPVNLGLAGAFQAGLKYARRHGYDCAVQFDADGQHRPEYLDAMVGRVAPRPGAGGGPGAGSDIVIGSRFVNAPKPASMRMLGSGMLAAMIRLTTGKRVADPTSGMRAYGPRAIEVLASGPNLGPEPDTIAYLVSKRGMTLCEVPVCMAERAAGESYLDWRSSSAYMARMALSVLFLQFFR